MPFLFLLSSFFFFFNDTATTEIYTLSLHDALPICFQPRDLVFREAQSEVVLCCDRSEEHTSELQSHVNLVCRLLLEKKKKQHRQPISDTRKKPSCRTPKDSCHQKDLSFNSMPLLVRPCPGSPPLLNRFFFF